MHLVRIESFTSPSCFAMNDGDEHRPEAKCCFIVGDISVDEALELAARYRKEE